MGRWRNAVLALAVAWGAVAFASPISTAGTQKCEQKRVDACGCHHVYGLRHCHPNRRTSHCEAPVKTETPKLKTPVKTWSI
ncbi:MAG: hypothetical protein IRZ16_22390 [Myxococcaceae bacterium]|nr:hypothetical protein [Myxococcaceae bacterium]